MSLGDVGSSPTESNKQGFNMKSFKPVPTHMRYYTEEERFYISQLRETGCDCNFPLPVIFKDKDKVFCYWCSSQTPINPNVPNIIANSFYSLKDIFFGK